MPNDVMSITDVGALAAYLETGKEFQVEIGGGSVNFRPVKRCPSTGRDTYDYKRSCRGVWFDYQTKPNTTYRFCPKTSDAVGALNSQLWEDIRHQIEYARLERERRDEAAAKRRRIDAALGLLEACEKMNELAYSDAHYLAGVKTIVAATKER